MTHIVMFDEGKENEEPAGHIQVDDFVLLAWREGQVQVLQSDPGNNIRIEQAVRVLAEAMKQSDSQLTVLLGNIIGLAVEKGAENFMASIREAGT